jgi:hypothetical protein
MIRATLAPTLAVSLLCTNAHTTLARPLTDQELRIAALCTQSPKGHMMRRNYGDAITTELCTCFGVAFMSRTIREEYLRARNDPAMERIEDRVQHQCALDIEETHKPITR